MAKPRSQRTDKAQQGPKLPFVLTKEIGSKFNAAPVRKQHGSMFHVSNRKAARKAARKAKKMRNGQSHSNIRKPHSVPDQVTEPPRKKQRMDPVPLQRERHDAGDLQEEIKVQKQPVKKSKAKKTHFNELLTGDILKGTDEKAAQSELELQRRLAKKLGIKQKSEQATATIKVDDVLRDGRTSTSDSEDIASEPLDDSGEDQELPEENGEEVDLADIFLGGRDDSSDQQDSDLGDSGSDNDDMERASEDDETSSDDLSLDSGGEAEMNLSSDDESDEGSDDEDSSGSEGGHDDRAGKRQNGVTSTSGRNQASVGKYVPPAARSRAAQESSDESALRKRLIGLINKLSDPSLPGVAGEILAMFDAESRRAVTDIISELLLQAVAEGPRASDRFTCVTAAFVSGVSVRGDCIDFGANFLASLAQSLEAARSRQDSLAGSNLCNLLVQLYMTGLLGANCMFSFLEQLRSSFQEQDVAMIHLILKACGLKLRSDDSVAMKDFVVNVHSTAAEKKGEMTQRAEIMLELVVEIKNNRKAKNSPVSLESYLSQGSIRWLKESRVGDMQLKSLTWERLLDPQKKGLWWLPKAGELLQVPGMNKSLREQTQQFGDDLLQLAAKQRMNTDVRRAIFCIIMGSEDAADASERLLQLPLKGESQREIVRVAMECCLQEADWNPYYASLLSSILRTSQGHCVTTQFCLWDHLKTLKAQQGRRAFNLARLIASLVTSKALPFSALRAANLDALSSSNERLFWQTFFERVLQNAKDQAALISLLKPLAQPHLQTFACSIANYLQEDFDQGNISSKNVARIVENSVVARKVLLGFRRT